MSSFKNFTASALAALAICSFAVPAADESIPDPFANLRQAQGTPGAAGAPAVPAQPIVVPPPPVFEAQSWVLMDYATGRVITEQNSHAKIWPASLTKMMTSYVIGTEIKAGRLNMSDDVIIAEDAWSKKYTDSSKMFIEVGKSIKVGDLVRGIIIQSGNDACVALAIHLAGTQEAFVDVMNSYAAKLGLKDTHFSNVHGLFDEMNYSTAYDMALMGRALIRDLPEEYPIYSQKEFTFNNIKQYNRNRLLWDKSINVDGIKTGHLSQVGYNLVASGTENNMRLIAAVIGTKSEKARGDICKALLNYGFHYFEQYTPFTAQKPVLTRQVRMGEKKQVNLMLTQDLALMIPRGSQRDVRMSYKLKSSQFIAPLKKGDELGTVEVKLKDSIIATVPLVAGEDIGEGGFFTRLTDRVVMFFSGSDEPEEAEAQAAPAAEPAKAEAAAESAAAEAAPAESAKEEQK